MPLSPSVSSALMADKSAMSHQHGLMQITCPKCHNSYTVDHPIDAELVLCSRCGHEFPIDRETAAPSTTWHYCEGAFTQPPWHFSSSFSACSTILLHNSDKEAQTAAPLRSQAKLWPWLVSVLLLITATGIWVQQDAWLDNRSVRSTLIGLGINLEQRQKDWLIEPASVTSKWLKRDDNDQTLMIRGRISNLLNQPLAPPQIEVRFYSALDPQKVIDNRLLTITEEPSEQRIATSPYKPPAAVRVSETPLPFTLVIESLPNEIGDFTLTAKFKGKAEQR